MKRPDRGRVLAIGIDGADPALVRRWIEGGALPSLKVLLDQGVWGRVVSPAYAVSEAVWPTFITGSGPLQHGIYSLWPWRPETMDISFLDTNHLAPFWKDLAQEGYAVGVLDVPYAPVVGLPGGVEVAGWGAHELLHRRPESHPPALSAWLREGVGSHPFAHGTVDAAGPQDHKGLSRVVSLCLAGTRQRGALMARLLSERALDLFLAVFTEAHHASHLLWHTVDPTHPAHCREGTGYPAVVAQGLLDIYQEVDRQISRVVDAAGPETTILIFSLRGLRPAEGIPAILDPLFRALGLASLKGWRAKSWSERTRGAFSAIKRAIPSSLKRPYYRLASHSVKISLAQSGMMPAYDWSRTVAFPLPIDHHGSCIRLNLRGREAQGVLAPGQYEEMCQHLEGMLRGLRTEDGAPVVREVLRIARDSGGEPPWHLPDLIVHWDDGASASPLRLRTPPVSARPVGMKFTAQHTTEGFFILRPRLGSPGVLDSVAAEKLHRLLVGALEAR